MTTCLVAASDLHIGSTVALCTARVSLDDGGYYTASKAQRWLWQCWRDAWQKVETLRGDAPLWIVLNGDVMDGDHHESLQILPRSPEAQLALAADILDPVVQRTEHLFVVRGTAAHVGRSAWMEERLADDLGAECDPATGNKSWWHLLLDCERVRFDFAHHATGGNLPWTLPNAANRLAARTLLEYAMSGDKPPQVVVRSHKHRYRNSGDNYPVQAIGLPAWQLTTEYVSRIAPGALADIGLVAFMCDDGQYSTHPIRYRARRPKPWKRK